MSGGLQIGRGFAPDERQAVALLYWQAFGAKLGRVMGPKDKAIAFFAATLDPGYALTARDQSGALLGVAGFKTESGGLASGSFDQLREHYGGIGALWRGAFLDLLERRLAPGVFQMDGIFVDARARGKGVGTALLHAILTEAARREMAEVQLDVIDTNPRARELYERVGFRAVGHETLGPLRWVFGFSRSTRMSCEVTGDPPN